MGDLPATLVVFGVIGYIILRHCCHRTSFRWDALEWQQNVFESTAFGLALFGLARLLGPWIHKLTDRIPGSETAHAHVAQVLPFRFPGTVFLGIFLGLLMAAIANGIWPRVRALDRAVRNHGGSLRILLHDAHRTNRPVMLTLSNRKVYVGPVYVPPPIREPSHVVLFPTLSGHRTQETLEVAWTTDYADVYLEMIHAHERGEELKTSPEHFQLVLPLDTIVSATYFDRDIYDRHFDPKRKAEPKH